LLPLYLQGRTGVRGSFAQKARSSLAIESGRALSDRSAQIENERINKLGDFLGMDADLLKAGLASDEGRVSMLSQLEQSLSGISMDRFNQEMALLGLPATFIPGTSRQAEISANARGIEAQQYSKLAGSMLEQWDKSSSTSDSGYKNPSDYGSNYDYWGNTGESGAAG